MYISYLGFRYIHTPYYSSRLTSSGVVLCGVQRQYTILGKYSGVVSGVGTLVAVCLSALVVTTHISPVAVLTLLTAVYRRCTNNAKY